MRHTSQGSGDAVVNETKFFEFNAKAGGPFRLYVGGIEQPGFHIQEREAAERAGNLKLANPSDSVTYRHDYEVEAVLTTAGLAIAIDYAPTADSPPQITSTPNPFFVQGTPGTYDFKQNYTDDGNSPVIHAVTNVLPGGLQLNQNTGILSYDGAGVASVSQHALIVTDSVGSAQSSSFNININEPVIFDDYSDLPGNVENFGAVGDGVTDDTAAIQAAMDSDYAVYFPPLEFKITSAVTISKSKIVRCFGDIRSFLYPSTQGLKTNYQLDGTSLPYERPKKLGEQTRILVSSNHHAFVVEAPFIDWMGGCIDTRDIEGAINTAAFAVKAQTGGTEGRIDAVVIGTPDFRGASAKTGIWNGGDNDGTKGVHFIFTGQPSDARISNFTVNMEAMRGTHTGVSVDALTGTQKCYFNEYRVVTDDTHAVFQDYGSTDSLFYSNLQGGLVWTTQSQRDSIAASTVMGARNVYIYSQFADFDTSSTAGGTRWKQNVTYELTGNPIEYPDTRFNREYWQKSLGTPMTVTIPRLDYISIPINKGGFAAKADASGGYTVTNTKLSNASDDVNLYGKKKGAIVQSDTDGVLRVAVGSSPTDKWKEISGTNSAKDIAPA